MKKISLFLVCAILLSSCSLSLEQMFLLPVATTTPTSTATITPTELPSFTPTVATLTFTVTPTLVGIKTATPTPEFSATPPPFTPLVFITPNTATPSVQMDGFISIVVSETEFYKKGVCEPTSVNFTAQVANPASAAYVVLFVRFKSKYTGVTSEWTSITMKTLGGGTFTHELFGEDMKSVDGYKNSWVQYQFVTTNSSRREIGRTATFSERLTLLDCVPTPTLEIVPTATVLKP